MPTIPEVRDGSRVAVPIIAAPVTDYQVVTAATWSALATAVKALFATGWVPFGAAQQFSASVFNQALVKY